MARLMGLEARQTEHSVGTMAASTELKLEFWTAAMGTDGSIEGIDVKLEGWYAWGTIWLKRGGKHGSK